jgi:hypothetical protein
MTEDKTTKQNNVKQKYRPMFLMDLDAKIFKKYWQTKTNCTLKDFYHDQMRFIPMRQGSLNQNYDTLYKQNEGQK